MILSEKIISRVLVAEDKFNEWRKMGWYHDKIREPIYLHYLHGDKTKTLKGKEWIIMQLAKMYALSGTFSRLYWLRIKVYGRQLLAFVLGVKD